MELGSICMVFMAIFGGFMALKWLLGSINRWRFEAKLGEKRFSLPPGDLGLPFIGNMWSFLRAFKSSNPDSFIAKFVSRYGRVGLYKTVMFGNPSIIVTTPEASRKVLTDDEAFMPGWPTSTVKLIGEKSFIGLSYEEHKRLRKLTAAPVNGHEALSLYLFQIYNAMHFCLQFDRTSSGHMKFHLKENTLRGILGLCIDRWDQVRELRPGFGAV